MRSSYIILLSALLLSACQTQQSSFSSSAPETASNDTYVYSYPMNRRMARFYTKFHASLPSSAPASPLVEEQAPAEIAEALTPLATTVLYVEEFGPSLPLPMIAESQPELAPVLASNETETAAFSSDSRIDSDELGTVRGAFSPTDFNLSSGNILNGTNAHNNVSNSITGANSISDDALNVTGVGTVIQNSGNNVVIQSAFAITVELVAAPAP